MEGYIKLHRQILDWEWYSDVNTKLVFIHILLKANFKDMLWKGISIKRGQLFTSTSHLSSEIGISEKQIRSALKKLKNTKEIDVEGASHGTMITVCNYDVYQPNENDMGEQMGKPRASRGQQRKNDNNDNNDNNDKNNISLSEQNTPTPNSGENINDPAVPADLFTGQEKTGDVPLPMTYACLTTGAKNFPSTPLVAPYVSVKPINS